MQLIYRGYTFHYIPAQPQPYRQPRAINWRYQVADKGHSEVKPATLIFRQPRAINWRYKLPTIAN